MVCRGTLCAGAVETKTAHTADNIATEVFIVPFSSNYFVDFPYQITFKAN